VLQPGGELHLALEALRPERGGQLRVQHLERHHPVVAEVPGEEDRGHPTAPELPLDRVAGERRLQCIVEVGQGFGSQRRDVENYRALA